MMATTDVREKECYWIPHPAKMFKMLMIRRISGNTCHATTTDDNRDMTLNMSTCQFFPANSASVEDMTSLRHLHEAGILYNLQDRSQLHRQMPYTYISNVLIAVNPLRVVPEPSMETYYSPSISSCPPHPYGIAEAAYRQLILPNVTNRNQAVVIAGESGAGKTETAKIVLRYLCWRSSHQQVHSHGKTAQNYVKPIDQCLLLSNPILESFGNAKTSQNNNSSRVGKLLKIYFDSENNFRMVSGGIETFLLEKSRVSMVTEEERNFNVFYQLLAGVSTTLRKKWRLKKCEHYRYLNNDATPDIEGVDDGANFISLRESFSSVGITSLDQDCIFRTISAILSIGNVDFVEVPADHNEETIEEGGEEERSSEGPPPPPPKRPPQSEAAQVANVYLVEHAAELLGVPKDVLQQTLLEHVIDMSTLNKSGKFSEHQESDMRSPRTVAQAVYARDAMAKTIYQHLFTWIVQRIRESLHQTEDDLPFVGVLDIFGFESFQTNGFEQLLINYANESLQLLFINSILVSEQALFVEEGLQSNVSSTPFMSNQGCLDVIAAENNSIISYLDGVCMRPGVEERMFLSRLHTNIKKNPFLPSSSKTIDKRTQFKVRHYARSVVYTVGSFIPKNMDVKLSGLDELLESSTFYSSAKCTLFSTPASRSRTRSTSLPSETSTASISLLDETTGGNEISSSLRHTVGSAFVAQISTLSSLLESTTCSFVRCIKPNDTMTNGLFDPECVLKQLRCLGIVQTCAALKAGMPTRITITELEEMYRPLLPDKLFNQLHTLSSIHDSFIHALLWAHQIPSDSYRIGKTKLFFKVGRFSSLSELCQTKLDLDKETRLVSRLKLYISRICFRKWMSRYLCEAAFLALHKKSRVKLRGICSVQRTWKKYFHSSEFKRHKAVRRRWRMAIIKVKCALTFMQEVRLMVDANTMRVTAQEKATKTIERQEARLLELIEKEEAEAQMERTRASSLGGELDENDGTFDLALENEDDFPPSLDEFTRHRSLSASRNGSIGRRGSTGSGIGGLGSVAARNASIANFGGTSSASIAKTEMDVLVAASSLATVSVCLFRWQNIRLFTAFETWVDNISSQDDGNGSPIKIKKRVGALRSSLSFDKRNSLRNLSIAEDEDERTEVEQRLYEKSDNSDLSSSNRAPLVRQTSVASKVFSNVMMSTDGEDDSDVDRSSTPLTLRSENDSPLPERSSEQSSIMCYECQEQAPVYHCVNCKADYCQSCSQFVHDYCKHMKTHEVVEKSISDASRISNDQSNGNVTNNMPPLRKAVSEGAHISPQRRSSRSGFKAMDMTTGEDTQKNHCSIRTCMKPATKGVSIRFCDEHYEEFRSEMKISKKHDNEDGEGSGTQTLQQQVALLTKQLKESGQQPVEFVELCVARERMQAAVERLMQGEEAAENDIERWDKAIKMNPDYQIEMEEKAKKWEEDQRPINEECYVRMRKLIPPVLAESSLGSMMEDGLPKTIANRIRTKKILGMICTHPDDIKRIHIVDLQTKFSNQGLDIVEMRAIWFVMPEEFDLDGDGKKAKWRSLFRQKLEELTVKEEGKRLSTMEKRNNAYKGHDDLEVYDANTEIKKKVIAKSTAFDATEKPDINNKLGSGIKELRKQMAPEKPSADGPLLYLSGGSGNPDEGKKVYANLFLQKKTLVLYPNAEKAKEGAEVIEEIVLEKKHTIKVGPGSKTFCFMDGEKEIKAFQSDKARREMWVSSLNAVIKLLNVVKKVKKKEKKVEPEAKDDRPPPPSFLGEIGKKGGGGGGGDRPPPPSFLGAIANRKKGGGGGDVKPPAPSFLDAIANRKKGGGGGGGGDKPPAPSFLDAIANRKKSNGGGGGGGGGGSGGEKPPAPSFLDAIASRKKPDGGGGDSDSSPKKKVVRSRKEEEI